MKTREKLRTFHSLVLIVSHFIDRFVVRSYINIVNQSGMWLPPVFVLEFSSANRTLEGRILPAFNPQVFLQRVPPYVSLAALVTRPGLQRGSWKERVPIIKSFAQFVFLDCNIESARHNDCYLDLMYVAIRGANLKLL